MSHFFLSITCTGRSSEKGIPRRQQSVASTAATMKKPPGKGKATPQPRSFVQKYRIGKGGDVDKIVSADIGTLNAQP